MDIESENINEKKDIKPKSSETQRRGHKIKRDDNPKVFDLPCRRTVSVRLRYGGKILTFDCRDLVLDIGDWVLINDEEVMRMGMVTSKSVLWPNDPDSKRIYLSSGRSVIRLATRQDLAHQAENQLREREEYEYCLSSINSQRLQMKLVAAEITFDNFKTIFYYTAEERVDFRQLVKELVSRFRTRIEMRQIGVRLEAMMLGGMGICGRVFCCAGFLSSFSPVSVRMAKEQNLSLNTAKISGVCGRLMCCLAFENQGAHLGEGEGDEDVLIEENDPNLGVGERPK
ncbi:MAG: stage 0 sporulation protein [Deltaproteobacteria bacterium]|jgi:cell fate regulator YaaT (PSP1 superfamily)|nr:stage 0 sporulation protein [Deltaproteobacteria bacterium]